MPRRSKGARLWLRKRHGRPAQWVILDHGREIRTGAGEYDLSAAENALAEYLANKRRPQFGDGHPSHVLIADILADYGDNHGPTTRALTLSAVLSISSLSSLATNGLGDHECDVQRIRSLAHPAGQCAGQKEW